MYSGTEKVQHINSCFSYIRFWRWGCAINLQLFLLGRFVLIDLTHSHSVELVVTITTSSHEVDRRNHDDYYHQRQQDNKRNSHTQSNNCNKHPDTLKLVHI